MLQYLLNSSKSASVACLSNRAPKSCRIPNVGGRPSIDSTDGLGSRFSFRRIEDLRASTQRLCPSARMVSMASEDFPEPDGPQKTDFLGGGFSDLGCEDCFDVHCTM